MKEATRRWQAQFIGEETKTPNKEWEDFLMIPPKFFYPRKEYDKAVKEYEAKLKATKVDQFMATKSGIRKKNRKDLERSIRLFLDVITQSRSPKTGPELIKVLTAN